MDLFGFYIIFEYRKSFESRRFIRCWKHYLFKAFFLVKKKKIKKSAITRNLTQNTNFSLKLNDFLGFSLKNKKMVF